MKIYIAGPMRGRPLFNFPAFDQAARIIREQGGTPVSPADIDRAHGFDPSTLPEDWDWHTYPEDVADMRDIIRRDIEAIWECDAMLMLRGWRESTGAKAEYHLARWLGLDIEFQDEVDGAVEFLTSQPKRPEEPRDILQEALDITSNSRNEAYGHPYDDFSRTSAAFSPLIQHKLKDGEAFDANDLWRMMVVLKLSRDVHSRKRDNKVDIAGYARCGQLVAERMEDHDK